MRYHFNNVRLHVIELERYLQTKLDCSHRAPAAGQTIDIDILYIHIYGSDERFVKRTGIDLMTDNQVYEIERSGRATF